MELAQFARPPIGPPLGQFQFASAESFEDPREHHRFLFYCSRKGENQIATRQDMKSNLPWVLVSPSRTRRLSRIGGWTAHELATAVVRLRSARLRYPRHVRQCRAKQTDQWPNTANFKEVPRTSESCSSKITINFRHEKQPSKRPSLIK